MPRCDCYCEFLWVECSFLYKKKNHWLWIPSSGIFKCECAVPFFQLNSNTALFFCQCLSYTPTCQCKTIQSLLKTVKNTDQDRYTLCGNQSTCTSLSLKKHWSPHQEQIATSQAEKLSHHWKWQKCSTYSSVLQVEVALKVNLYELYINVWLRL